MAWTYKELVDFAYRAAQIWPTSAVAVTPLAFRDPPRLVMTWGECVFVGSSMYGSVRNQARRLYIWGQLDSAKLHCVPAHRPACLLADADREVGKTAQKDELCFTLVIPFGRVAGLAVMVGNVEGQRYSSPTHIPQLTMSGIWSGEPRWPKCEQPEESRRIGKR